MAYLCCDVTKKLIQDGGQFADLGENISRSKTDMKFFFDFLHLFQMTRVKFLLPFRFKQHELKNVQALLYKFKDIQGRKIEIV